MDISQLIGAAQRVRGHEEWLGLLWLERGRLLAQIEAGTPLTVVFESLRRRVRDEGTLQGKRHGVKEIPVDPRSLDR